MTDKKVAPLRAITKEPTKPTTYKVKEDLISRLEALVEDMKKETDYEVGEQALTVAVECVNLVMSGSVHDIITILHHKDSTDLSGVLPIFGLCPETNANPFKLLTLAKYALATEEEHLAFGVGGNVDE